MSTTGSSAPRVLPLEFFRMLFPTLEQEFVETRLINLRTKDSKQFFCGDVATLLQDLPAKLANLTEYQAYFGVAPRHTNTGGTKKDISRVWVLWADVDAKAFAGGKPEALKRIQEFPIQPTAIIDSGNGYHVYYLLKEPEDTTDPKNVQRVEAALKALARGLNGDPAAAELARVLRIPGTVNTKDPIRPLPVGIVSLNPERAINLGDIEDLLGTSNGGEVEQQFKGNPPGWVADAIKDIRPNENRHTTVIKLSGLFHQKGLLPDDIIALLRPHVVSPGYSGDELRKDVEDVCWRYQPPPGGEHLTDLGNAKRLVGRHGRDLHYCHLWGKWLVWDDKRWRTDETGTIVRLATETVQSIYAEAAACPIAEKREAIARWAHKSEQEARIRAMIALATSEAGVPILPSILDRDPWSINSLSGTINLRTGVLREHRREDLITKLAPTKYDPDAPAPRWEAFLQRIMGNNAGMIRYLQRAIGYALTGTTQEQVLFFLYGTGENGKTTFLNAILDTMGLDYSKQAPPGLLMVKKYEAHPTELADLFGVRFVSTVEVESGKLLAEALVKQLTGGDRIKARRMREDFWEFDPTHKIFLAANHRPAIRGADHAIWRRIRLIPFNVVIPEQERDRQLAWKLKEEAPGILAWAVRGCLKWQAQGLQDPAEVLAATAAYKQEMDLLGDFLTECCVVRQGARAAAGALYEVYINWCKKNGESALSQKSLSIRLRERGFAPDRTGRVRYWVGLELTPAAEQQAYESELADTSK